MMSAHADRGYDRVDQADRDDLSRLIGLLEEQKSLRSNQIIIQNMIEMLDVQPGDRVLEVGAGTGEDTCRLAALASPDGEAIGIDISEIMVAEAKRRASEATVPVTFQTGDVQQLDFPDNSFDRVWSERTFLWLQEPHRAFQEIVRVTRPGGRIVISTVDTASSIRGGFEPELNDRLNKRGPKSMPFPAIGRELPAMCLESGLSSIVVQPHLVDLEAPLPTSAIGRTIIMNVVERALTEGIFSQDDADRYERSLAKAIEHGSYFLVVTAFIVAGTKPV